MSLENAVRINGREFPAGSKVIVPKDQADDIKRIDEEHEKLKKSYHQKQVNIVAGPTISVGNGAN